MSQTPALSIIVPVFNESANIAAICSGLHKAFASPDWEVIFVDDDSPDRTWETAKAIAQQDPHVRVIRRLHRKGLSSAVLEGMLSSSAPYVAVMDGDGQHDETLLPKMLARLQSDADIVVATRYVEGGSAQGLSNAGRKFLSEGGNKLANLVLNVKTTDPMSGFFALRRDLVEIIAPSFKGKGFKVLFDILARAPQSTRLIELPFTFRERLAGESKLSWKVFVQALKQLILLGVKKIIARA